MPGLDMGKFRAKKAEFLLLTGVTVM